MLSVTTSAVDNTAPTISNITSSLANGTYKAGQVVDVSVTFSEEVTSSGNVTVNFDTGRSCTFTIASSITGTCNYTVQSGDNSSDLTVSSVSGTIADATGLLITYPAAEELHLLFLILCRQGMLLPISITYRPIRSR